MAFMSLVKFDVSQLDDLMVDLTKLTPEEFAEASVDAVNFATKSAYERARKTMLSGINLTEDYVQRKMAVSMATNMKPEAEIVAFGGKGYLTNLSHYGAEQMVDPVTWTNEWIAGQGFEFGDWPGWTKRVGRPELGIEVGEKAAGKSVEVVKGKRKPMGSIFSLPGKNDSEGNPILFRRLKPARKRVEALTGPSVYQLFRRAIPLIEDDVEDDLQGALAEMAEARLKELIL